MQAFILALGTRGDIELFLTLGCELVRRGHRVYFVAAELYEPRIREAGLFPVSLGAGTLEQAQAVLRSLSSVPKEQRPGRFYEQWIAPQVPLAVQQIERFPGEIDFFICNMKLGLRRRGRILPGAAVTYDPPDSLEELRRRRASEHAERLIEIVALPKALLDPNGVWDPKYHFTGFWDEPSFAGWEPPADLVRFVEAEPPPVVLTMGSMVTFDAKRLASTLFEALGRVGSRAVVVEGWSNFPRVDAFQDRLHIAKEVPYGWLFEKTSCVIHHGGTGTLAAVLRAGRPSILLPQLACQETFGEILIRENLAADALDVETVDADRLASALRRVHEDERLQQSARAWQKLRKAEKGVVAAADLIEVHWEKLRQPPAR
ncbi:MAG TPA: glycosyltransferase [Planctomycetaceae bacterium]|jgi:UDP:flavonoid glycosyltransferase YjiC (YdhE family)|nr:glycosyltransferase [Planctomycetaceae bacterium]